MEVVNLQQVEKLFQIELKDFNSPKFTTLMGGCG